MNARLRLSLALAIVVGLGQTAIAGKDLTNADIPPGLSPDLKATIEKTFSDKAETRLDAVERFKKAGEAASPAVPFMLLLLNDRDLSVEISAMDVLEEGLQKYPAFRKIPELVQTLVHISRSRESRARANAAALLGKCRSPDAFEPLKALLKDTDHHVRDNAVHALGELGDGRAVSDLAQFLADARYDIDTRTVEACDAEMAIGKIGAAQAGQERDLAFTFLDNPIQSWELNNACKFADIREGAILGLGLLGDQRAVPLLESALKDKIGAPHKVRECAATALADICGRDAAPVLKQFATDRDEHRNVRGAAAVALVRVTNGEIDGLAVVEAIRYYSSEGVNWSVIAKHGKTEAVRRAAAIEHVHATLGMIDDIAIVKAIRLPPEDSQSRKAMMQIAKHGSTKAVRAAAQRYLAKSDIESLRKEGLLVTPQEVSDEMKKH